MLAGALPEAERAALAHHAETCGTTLAAAAQPAEPLTDGAPAGTLDRRAAAGTRPPPGATEFSGTDRFELVRRIGVGGMGVVYEVWDRERQARFALKTLPPLSQHRLGPFRPIMEALESQRRAR